MFIQTEETPNPNSLKFSPGQEIRGNLPPLFFTDINSCNNSPLARQLMSLEGVMEVLLGSDFITVTKHENENWYSLKPYVLGLLMEAFTNNLPITIEDVTVDKVSNGLASSAQQSNQGENNQDSQDPLVRQICELLETRIRPAVAQDGGDIVFVSFEEGVVYLQLKGACSGCPSSSATLKHGIENMLKYYVPEIKEVRAA